MCSCLLSIPPAGYSLVGGQTSGRQLTVSLQSHSLRAKLACHADPRLSWWITVVYGPLEAAAQQAFLDELTVLRSSLSGPWLLFGDFNMIYRAADKNNIVSIVAASGTLAVSWARWLWRSCTSTDVFSPGPTSARTRPWSASTVPSPWLTG